MYAVIDATEPHRSYARQNRDRAAFFYTHFVGMRFVMRVIVFVIARDDAGHRFCERSLKITFAVIRDKAIRFHNFVGNNDVLRIPADKSVRIPRGGKGIFGAVHRRLNTKLLPFFKLMLPFFADL